jgi:hypothetical protein
MGLTIQNKIARRSERIARWDRDAAETELSWAGGIAYKRFCEDMANAARQERGKLEVEFQQLQS